MKKNVLLLTIDALGADKCWDLKKNYTPNLAAISKKGVTFKNVISTTSSTTTSIASIHTGLYPYQHGIRSTYGFQLKNSISTLAEILKRNSYSTFSNVGGALKSETDLCKGFDKYVYSPSHFVLKILRWGIPIQRMWINNFYLMSEIKSIIHSPGPWFFWIHFLDLHNRWRSKKYFKKRNISNYENALISLDNKIKSILNEFDLLKTLVVITADHGHYVAELDPKREDFDYPEAHGFHIYDTLVHVPLIMIGKGLLPEGVLIEKLISSVDIFPSIIDILGCQSDVETSGQSFADLILSGNYKKLGRFTEKPVYMEACGSILKRAGKSYLMGIRTPYWKLVIPQDANSKRPPELYNIIYDPDELVNVYDKHPMIAKQLFDKLMSMVAEQHRV